MSTSRRWLVLYAPREVGGGRGVESVQLRRVSQPKLKSQSLKFTPNKPEEVRERSIYYVIYFGYDALTNCSRLLLSKLEFATVLWGLMCRLLYAN